MEKLLEELASAVRWAPSSAYWSDRLREMLGEEAMAGIDALTIKYRRALGELQEATIKYQRALGELQEAKELLVLAASRLGEQDGLGGDIKRFLSSGGV